MVGIEIPDYSQVLGSLKARILKISRFVLALLTQLFSKRAQD
jgi:hypothetical protein